MMRMMVKLAERNCAVRSCANPLCAVRNGQGAGGHPLHPEINDHESSGADRLGDIPQVRVTCRCNWRPAVVHYPAARLSSLRTKRCAFVPGGASPGQFGLKPSVHPEPVELIPALRWGTFWFECCHFAWKLNWKSRNFSSFQDEQTGFSLNLLSEAGAWLGG